MAIFQNKLQVEYNKSLLGSILLLLEKSKLILSTNSQYEMPMNIFTNNQDYLTFLKNLEILKTKGIIIDYSPSEFYEDGITPKPKSKYILCFNKIDLENMQSFIKYINKGNYNILKLLIELTTDDIKRSTIPIQIYMLFYNTYDNDNKKIFMYELKKTLDKICFNNYTLTNGQYKILKKYIESNWDALPSERKVAEFLWKVYQPLMVLGTTFYKDDSSISFPLFGKISKDNRSQTCKEFLGQDTFQGLGVLYAVLMEYGDAIKMSFEQMIKFESIEILNMDIDILSEHYKVFTKDYKKLKTLPGRENNGNINKNKLSLLNTLFNKLFSNLKISFNPKQKTIKLKFDISKK